MASNWQKKERYQHLFNYMSQSHFIVEQQSKINKFIACSHRNRCCFQTQQKLSKLVGKICIFLHLVDLRTWFIQKMSIFLQSQSNQNPMATPNSHFFFNPQPFQQDRSDELSYSTMVKDLDAAQDQQYQVQMAPQQPINVHFSHKNAPIPTDAALQAQNFNNFISLRTNMKIAIPREEALQNYPFPAVKPHQEERPLSLDSFGIKPKPVPKKEDDRAPIQQIFNSKQNAFLIAPTQNKNFRHKGLGQKLIDSRIIKQVSKSAEPSQVYDQSLILTQTEQEESIMHFEPAKFDTSEEQDAKQFQQQKPNQHNVVITISKGKEKQKQAKNFHEEPSILKQEQQVKYSYQNEPKQVDRKDQQKQDIKYKTMQNYQEIAGFKKLHQNNNDIEGKKVNAKNYNSTAYQIETPNQSRKLQVPEKNKVRIEVSNRMKSTYDPTGKNTQFKLANGGNLSQPDQRQGKTQRIKKETQLFQQSESQAQKVKKIQYQNVRGAQASKGKKAKNEKLQQAFIRFQKTITQNQDTYHFKKEQFDDNAYRKPTIHKIKIMKKLAPEQLFNGFSLIQTDQKDKRQQFNKQKHGQLSSMIVEQIQNLKKKIKELQKVSSKRQQLREQFKLQRVYSDKNNFSTRKISVNFRDYHQTSLERVISKKNTILKRDISSSISFSEDDFFELQALMSFSRKIPKPYNTQQELAELSLNIFEKLGVHPDQYGHMDIARFMQGVHFELNQGPTLIWYYDGLMFVGQRRNNRQKNLEMQGEGILIFPNIFCYKGMFSKNKKHGFGLYLNAKGEKYKGDWKADCYHGKGRLNSELSVYQGYFSKGLKHGQGVEYFPNGDVYEGEYENGDFHGKGRYCWKNKTTYVGEFRMGYMEGQGLWRSKKDSYQGQYYRNMKHGYGVYRWANGKVYEGKFEHGHRAQKKNPKKPIIEVEKEITCDVDLSSQSDSEFHEFKLNQNGFKIGRRFTIQSGQETPKQRKRPSKFNLVKQ